MACINCRYVSFTLKRNVEINVIVPTPEKNERITDESTKSIYHYDTGLPVLYLLHGAYGDASVWTRFSCIERYAQKNCCVVVMASAENSFIRTCSEGEHIILFLRKNFQPTLPVSSRFQKSVRIHISPACPWADMVPGSWDSPDRISIQKPQACRVPWISQLLRGK